MGFDGILAVDKTCAIYRVMNNLTADFDDVHTGPWFLDSVSVATRVVAMFGKTEKR